MIFYKVSSSNKSNLFIHFKKTKIFSIEDVVCWHCPKPIFSLQVIKSNPTCFIANGVLLNMIIVS